MKEGVGRNGGCSSPSAQLLGLRSSSRSRSPRSSHSDASLPASSSAGTSLPTSVVERKSSTAWLHLISEEAPDLEPALPPPAFLPRLCPQDLLRGPPLRAHLEEAIPCLRPVPAPRALSARRRTSWNYPQPRCRASAYSASCTSSWRPARLCRLLLGDLSLGVCGGSGKRCPPSAPSTLAIPRRGRQAPPLPAWPIRRPSRPNEKWSVPWA